MKPLLAIALVGLAACGKAADPGPVGAPQASSSTGAPSASSASLTTGIATAGSGTGTGTGSGSGSGSGDASTTALSEAQDSNGKLLSAAVLAKVCAGPCGGPTARVKVYRDASGKVARLFRIYGSCTHPPAIYFSPEGKEGDSIAEKPIVPGSEEARRFDAIRDANTKGLTMTDSVSCRDGSRSAP